MTGGLIAAILCASSVWAIGPASPEAVSRIRGYLDKVKDADLDITNIEIKIAKLKSKEATSKNLALLEAHEMILEEAKRTFGQNYQQQQAVRETIKGYGITPTDEFGSPIAHGIMATENFHGEDRPWLILGMRPSPISAENSKGEKLSWPHQPQDALQSVESKLNDIRVDNNGVTIENGISMIWGLFDDPYELAYVINHEYVHYRLFQDPKWAKKSSEEIELEVRERDIGTVSLFAPDPKTEDVLKNFARQRRDDQLIKVKSLRKTNSGITGIFKNIMTSGHSTAGKSKELRLTNEELKTISEHARTIRESLDRDRKERRLAEKEARRREEQARVERDDFQFAIYWIFNECRGTPSLPIQGNFARLLATRPDARKTLRRLASFEYTKAENAVLSECVELLIRSLPDYPNAEQIEIDRNWARRVRHEANERATVHPPAKSLPSVTRRSGPLPVIPYPSQPPQPQQPAPAQPAPEPERPYMKPCINGRCLDLH